MAPTFPTGDSPGPRSPRSWAGQLAMATAPWPPLTRTPRPWEWPPRVAHWPPHREPLPTPSGSPPWRRRTLTRPTPRWCTPPSDSTPRSLHWTSVAHSDRPWAPCGPASPARVELWWWRPTSGSAYPPDPRTAGAVTARQPSSPDRPTTAHCWPSTWAGPRPLVNSPTAGVRRAAPTPAHGRTASVSRPMCPWSDRHGPTPWLPLA